MNKKVVTTVVIKFSITNGSIMLLIQEPGSCTWNRITR